MADKKKCFIITPIGKKGSDIRRRTEGVIDGIITPVMEADYEIEVAHRLFEEGSINKQVMDKICQSDLVIADLTGNNPNVMYELALRHTLGSPCIIIAEEDTELPFDIKGERTVFYKNDFAGSLEAKENLKKRLIQIKQNHNDKKSKSPIHSYIGAEEILNKIINYSDKSIANKSLLSLSDDIISQLSNVGLSAFYRNRNEYSIFRKSDDGKILPNLRDYLSIARKSIKAVVFTFAHSVVFENLCQFFKEKLESSSDFTILISLLNPYESLYYQSSHTTHDRGGDIDMLIKEAKQTVDLLRKLKNSLAPETKKRFVIKLHNTALFETAVLIDDDEDYGRIQVEIQPYKVNALERFAFEIRKSIDNPKFYNKIKNSYNQLLNDATSLEEIEQKGFFDKKQESKEVDNKIQELNNKIQELEKGFEIKEW